MPRRFLTALVVAGVCLVLGSGAALAIGKNRNISGNHDRTIYEVGQSVNIDGSVTGDVFCLGQNVNINANVSGDVICAGQTVDINGHVGGSVRVAAQTVNLGAKVGQAASVLAQDVNFQPGASVGSDLSLVASNTNVDGSVGRDINGVGHNLNLNGPVGRNVSARVSQLNLDGGAKINGSLSYTSKNHLSRQAGSVVAGSVSYHKPSAHGHGSSWLWRLVLALSLVIFSVVLAALFPAFFVRANKIGRSRFWASLLVGFVAFFMVPIVMVALLVSVLGWPLAILIGLVWATVLVLSLPVCGYLLGRLIYSDSGHVVLSMLIGSAILALILYFVPIVRILVAILVVLIGSGCLLIDLKRFATKPNYKTS